MAYSCEGYKYKFENLVDSYIFLNRSKNDVFSSLDINKTALRFHFVLKYFFLVTLKF